MNNIQAKALRIKRQYQMEWLSLEGVTAVGLGQIGESMGIIISMEDEKHKKQTLIPTEIEGIPIKVEVSGPVRPK